MHLAVPVGVEATALKFLLVGLPTAQGDFTVCLAPMGGGDTIPNVVKVYECSYSRISALKVRCRQCLIGAGYQPYLLREYILVRTLLSFN